MTTFITVEPYSRSRAAVELPRNVEGAAGGGGGGRVQGQEVRYDQMTGEEKAAKCCAAFNSAKGCSNRRCGLKHQCSAVDKARNRVCWSRSHALPQHK